MRVKAFQVANDNMWMREKNGGDEGTRTPDLGNASAALSRLSYVPGLANDGDKKRSPLLPSATNRRTLI